MKPTRTQIAAVFGVLLLVGMAIPMAAANMHIPENDTADNDTQTEDEQAVEEQELPEQAQGPPQAQQQPPQTPPEQPPQASPPENVTVPSPDNATQGIQQLIQVLLLISDELEEINERLDRIEGQLDAHTNETLDNDTLNDTELTNDTFLNDTTTDLNETELNETITDNETNVTPSTADVNFQNQLTAGEIVVVNWAALPEDGYVALHDSSLLTAETTDEVVNSVIGVSDQLEAGNHSTVTVNMTQERWGLNGTELQDDQLLIAMPHEETNDNTAYDFVTSNGEEDGPFFVDNDPDQGPVTDDANVTLAASDTDTVNETETDTGNETDNETVNETL